MQPTAPFSRRHLALTGLVGSVTALVGEANAAAAQSPRWPYPEARPS